MNEEYPIESGEQPEQIESVVEMVGPLATETILKGAGTLSEVMGVEAAAKYVRQTKINRRKSYALARRMYRPLTLHDRIRRRRSHNES